jgi:hypothetical protein
VRASEVSHVTAPPGSIVGDDLIAVFRAAGGYLHHHPRRPGWHVVRCPWAEGHSNGDVKALLIEPGASAAPGWGFSCLHAHCDGHGIGAVLDRFGLRRRRT